MPSPWSWAEAVEAAFHIHALQVSEWYQARKAEMRMIDSLLASNRRGHGRGGILRRLARVRPKPPPGGPRVILPR